MNALIYADFNGITGFPNDENEYLDICGYGTLASLSRHKVRLEEGMAITFFEPGDLEMDATVHFFPDIVDAHNPHGKWFAKLVGMQRDNHADEREPNIPHVCFNCRNNLAQTFKEKGRQYKELCSVCDTPVMYPLLPPEND